MTLHKQSRFCEITGQLCEGRHRAQQHQLIEQCKPSNHSSTITLSMIELPPGRQCHGIWLLKRNREVFGKSAVACAIPLPVG